MQFYVSFSVFLFKKHTKSIFVCHFWTKSFENTHFHSKYTIKRSFMCHWSENECLSTDFDPHSRFGGQMTPKPPFGGGIPIRDYTPPKKCQKRTDFRTSQSSYRAKSQRSSPILMKMQNRLFSLRILKEKIAFFPKDSLGKVGVRKFWRAFLTFWPPFWLYSAWSGVIFGVPFLGPF